MNIEEEYLMDDPNIEVKFEDEQNFDAAFKNSGEEDQDEEDEENEGIVDKNKVQKKKVDLEEEYEMTDLETDKKKKKNKLNKLSQKRDSESYDKSSEDDKQKYGKKKNKRKDSFVEDSDDSDEDCQIQPKRKKARQNGKVDIDDSNDIKDNNKLNNEEIVQLELAKTKGKLNKTKKNSDDDEYEPGSEIIKKKKVAPKKKEEKKEQQHSKAKATNKNDDEDEEDEEGNESSDRKQTKPSRTEAKEDKTKHADKSAEKENEDKSAGNNNFPFNLLFDQNGSKNKNLESLFSNPQQQAFLMALLEQQSKQANNLTDKKKKFMEDISDTENSKEKGNKIKKSRELRALEADREKSENERDKRNTRTKVSNIKYVESDLEDLPEQFEERPRDLKKPKGPRQRQERQEKQIKEQPQKFIEKQLETKLYDNVAIAQNYQNVNNFNPQISQEERVREYQEHQAKLEKMLGKYSHAKPISRVADQRVENEMERLQMEQEFDEDNNRIEEIQQILPKEGHFRNNDIPRGIAASRIIGDDIFLEVTWEKRKNGETPESTVMSTAEIKHFDYSFLLDYYEAKILKTNKERIKNIKNGEQQNNSQSQQSIPKSQNSQGNRNNNSNYTRNTTNSTIQSNGAMQQANKKNKQKGNIMVDLEQTNEILLGDTIIEDPYKQFMKDNQVFEISDSEVVTQPLSSKPGNNINKSNNQPQDRVNCMSIDSDDECIPYNSSKGMRQNYFDIS